MFNYLVSGSIYFVPGQTQWAPTLTAHDPSPPITLEDVQLDKIGVVGGYTHVTNKSQVRSSARNALLLVLVDVAAVPDAPPAPKKPFFEPVRDYFAPARVNPRWIYSIDFQAAVPDPLFQLHRETKVLPVEPFAKSVDLSKWALQLPEVTNTVLSHRVPQWVQSELFAKPVDLARWSLQLPEVNPQLLSRRRAHFTPEQALASGLSTSKWLTIDFTPVATQLDATMLGAMQVRNFATNVTFEAIPLGYVIGPDVASVGPEADITALRPRTWKFFDAQPIAQPNRTEAIATGYTFPDVAAPNQPDITQLRRKPSPFADPQVTQPDRSNNAARLALDTPDFEIAGVLGSGEMAPPRGLAYEGRGATLKIAFTFPDVAPANVADVLALLTAIPAPQFIDSQVFTARPRSALIWADVPNPTVDDGFIVQTKKFAQYFTRVESLGGGAPLSRYLLLGPDPYPLRPRAGAQIQNADLFAWPRQFRVTQLNLPVVPPPGAYQFVTKRDPFVLPPSTYLKESFGQWQLVVRPGALPGYRCLFDLGRLEIIEIDLLVKPVHTVADLGRLELIELPEYP